MNIISIIARAVEQPELKRSKDGKPFLRMRVALNDGYGDRKKTIWLGVTCFDKTAELVAEHVTKGQLVGITGKIQQDEWTPKDSDKPVTSTYITASTVDFLEKPRDAQPASTAPRAAHNADGSTTSRGRNPF